MSAVAHYKGPLVADSFFLGLSAPAIISFFEISRWEEKMDIIKEGVLVGVLIFGIVCLCYFLEKKKPGYFYERKR